MENISVYASFKPTIGNNFIYDSHMEDAENRFMGKKRKRSYNYTTNIEGMKYSKRKGRKEKNDTSQRPHNKNTSDNIIKKCM